MLNEVYEEYLKDDNVKVVGICLDGIGRIDHVKPFVYGNDLDIEVYVDKNGDFKRAMHVTDTPFTILLNKEMNSRCRIQTYSTINFFLILVNEILILSVEPRNNHPITEG